MASQFYSKYFAIISNDGELLLWNTEKNELEQKFTPNYHLTSPCISLHFIQLLNTTKNGSPRKKIKRNESVSKDISPFIALGTTSGLLLIYSIAKAEQHFSIDSQLQQPIKCITWENESDVYSAAEQNILCWDLQKRTIKSKWKAGNEKISAILRIPDSNKLLTASKNIKLWDISLKQLLNTFTGHSTEVNYLHFINPHQNDGYFISSAKGDRIVSCWSLDGTRTAVSSYLTEDNVTQLNAHVDSEGSTQMAIVTRSGVCHVYRHTLNGKASKPLKPKTTLRVVSDSGDKGAVIPIPIMGACIPDDGTVTIAHGNNVHLMFESLVPNEYEKVQCIIRKDPRLNGKVDSQVSKTKAVVTNGDVHYLTPHTLNNVTKRKADGATEVPMEKRLENLTLNKLDVTSKVPKANNVAQLLLQGIHSKDKNILRSVLSKRDENVIRNTIKRLPMSVIVPLVEELTSLIQGKTLACQTGVLWLKTVLQIHAGILVSNPELSELLSPVMSSIESRLSLQTPLNRLRGRLDLLVSQLNVSNVTEESDDQALLVFNDKASSDSEMDGLDVGAGHSESDNEWSEEDSEMDDEGVNVEENSDEEMST